MSRVEDSAAIGWRREQAGLNASSARRRAQGGAEPRRSHIGPVYSRAPNASSMSSGASFSCASSSFFCSISLPSSFRGSGLRLCSGECKLNVSAGHWTLSSG
jgi:hypothetical protein